MYQLWYCRWYISQPLVIYRSTVGQVLVNYRSIYGSIHRWILDWYHSTICYILVHTRYIYWPILEHAPVKYRPMYQRMYLWLEHRLKYRWSVGEVSVKYRWGIGEVFLGCTWCHNLLKSETKESPKLLSSSGIRGDKFMSVNNFLAQ